MSLPRERLSCSEDMATLQATNSLPALQHQACAQSQFSFSSSFRLPEPAARPSSPFHTLSSRKSVQNPLPKTVSAASHHHHSAALNASEKDASVSVGNEATTSDPLERAIPNPSDLDLSMYRRTLLSITTATIPALLSQIFPEFPAHALVPSLQSAPSGEVSLPISPSSAASTVNLTILGDCVLGVSLYPDFVYNPRGGGGVATAVECEDGRLKVDFDLSTVYIPAVEFSTTTLLGAPLPPPLRIDIESQGLEGYIDRRTGQVSSIYSTFTPLYYTWQHFPSPRRDSRMPWSGPSSSWLLWTCIQCDTNFRENKDGEFGSLDSKFISCLKACHPTRTMLAIVVTMIVR